MRKGYRKLEEMSTGDLGFSLDEVRGRSLAELARMGGKMLLEVAMREEVAECLGRDRYERGGEATGYRNGKRRRTVQMGAGPIEIDIPKVTGSLLPLRSEVLPAFQRRTAELEEVIAQLYAEGLSTRDFQRALGGFWGESGLSRSSVSRANETLKESFSAWRCWCCSG